MDGAFYFKGREKREKVKSRNINRKMQIINRARLNNNKRPFRALSEREIVLLDAPL